MIGALLGTKLGLASVCAVGATGYETPCHGEREFTRDNVISRGIRIPRRS